MSALFQPYTLKDVTLRNRIAIPPMCQYMAVDGRVNDWHQAHYTSLARGGAGLVIVEATAVAPEGRITPGCTGIWNDGLAQAFAPIVQAIKAAGSVPGSRSHMPDARPAPTSHGKATTILLKVTHAAGKRLPHPPSPTAKACRKCHVR